MKSRILVIDDEPAFIQKLRYAFREFQLEEALTVGDSKHALQNNNYDLILLDLNLDPTAKALEGLALIQPIKSSHPNIPLVVVTADEQTETIVTAMKAGADDYLRKSEFDLLAWRKKFKVYIENKRLHERLNKIEAEQAEQYIFVGNSPEIDRIKQTLSHLAENPQITVLLTGETGVGKEVAARYLHQISQRKNKPFIAVNLSTIQNTLLESALFGHKKGAFTGANYEREGYFRKANGGILFLDEIGDISQDIQIKLLRFLENKTIQIVGDEKDIQLDLQIVVATNQNLKSLMEKGQFREELYYRIKHYQVDIPPLRDRRSDIIELLHHFLGRLGYENPDDILTDEVKQKLMVYDWPGNVRELKYTVDTMVLKMKIMRKSKIELACLPEEILHTRDKVTSFVTYSEISEKTQMKSQFAQVELSSIENALKKTYGQKQAAADLLGMNADQLRYRVLKYWQQNPQMVNQYDSIVKYYKLGS